MLYGHFERLQPVCPPCRASGLLQRLRISLVEAECRGDVSTGIVGCPHCGAEFPIIEGLPIIVPDVRRYVQDSAFYLLARDDLGPATESLIADAVGPNAAVDMMRQHLSSYGWDHWADHDPLEVIRAGDPRPGAVARLATAALDLLPDGPEVGPLLDIGCGAGRSAVELARRTGRMVLAIDISVPLARLARRAVIDRKVSYPRRRVGLVYDRRTFDLALDLPSDAVDVWICDALALPFADDSFGAVTSLNVIDCLSDPRGGISEVARILQKDGAAVFSTPFDWSGNVTPLSAWLGGHSQRGPHHGSAEAVLDMLLSDGDLGTGGLRKIAATDKISWCVRLHDRAVMHYQPYLIAARKQLSTS